MILHHAIFATPLGPFSVAVDPDGALVAAAFGELSVLRRRIPHFDTAAELLPDAKGARTADVRSQIDSYFRGKLRTFDLPLRANGTMFQKHVWDELNRIPFGETRSYGELARILRTSARAIGNANGRNPLCLIVPCHRVIGTNGALTGFAFGESLKRRLLDHEVAWASRPRV